MKVAWRRPMIERRATADPKESRFILHRFNGDEVYGFLSARMFAFPQEGGEHGERRVALWFEVEADPAAIQRCEDTAGSGMTPSAEVCVELLGLGARLLVGREF